jgi:hypothetical protein
LLTDMAMRSMGGDSHDHTHGSGHKQDNKESDEKNCDGGGPSSGEVKASTILLTLTADALHNVSKQQTSISHVL